MSWALPAIYHNVVYETIEHICALLSIKNPAILPVFQLFGWMPNVKYFVSLVNLPNLGLAGQLPVILWIS